MLLLETNIDDSPPEWLGKDFQEGLLQHGAIDFYMTPISMKKGRQGLKLSVLTEEKTLQKVSDYILENTTSIGLRYYPVARIILERESFEMPTPYGSVKVKAVITPSGQKRYKIEHESLLEIKKKYDLSLPHLQVELLKILNYEKR